MPIYLEETKRTSKAVLLVIIDRSSLETFMARRNKAATASSGGNGDSGKLHVKGMNFRKRQRRIAELAMGNEDNSAVLGYGI